MQVRACKQAMFYLVSSTSENTYASRVIWQYRSYISSWFRRRWCGDAVKCMTTTLPCMQAVQQGISVCSWNRHAVCNYCRDLGLTEWVTCRLSSRHVVELLCYCVVNAPLPTLWKMCACVVFDWWAEPEWCCFVEILQLFGALPFGRCVRKKVKCTDNQVVCREVCFSCKAGSES